MYIKIKAHPSLMGKFIYELKMLNEVFSLAMGRTSNNMYEKNAGLESFLVHARIIIDFLSDNKQNQKDDLTCSDFFDVSGQNIRAISLVPIPEDLRTKINKHLSHLTKTRVQEKIGWQLNLIKNTLNQKSKFFLEQCSLDCFPNKEERMKELAPYF